MKISNLQSIVSAVLSVCSERDRRVLAALLMMMLVSAGLEVLGIGIIVPYVSLLADPGLIQDNQFISEVYSVLGVKDVNLFVLLLGALLLLLYVIKGTFIFIQTYVQSRFLFNKHARLAHELYAAYLFKPYDFHLHRESADLIRNVTVEAGNITKGVMLPILMFLADAVMTVSICMLLLYIEPLVAAVVSVLMFVVFYIIVNAMGKKIASYGRVRKNSAAEMTKWVRQGLEGIKEVKILAKEEFFADTFSNITRSYVHSGKMFAVLSVVPRLILENVIIVVMLLVITMVVLRGGEVQEAVDPLILFAVAAIRILPSVNRMISAVNSFIYYIPSINTIHEDLDMVDGQSTKPLQRKEKASLHRDIVFDSVSFRYPGSTEWAVKDISLTINKGDAVAIVGRSGSGKSTLMNLILCFYEAQEGSLKIDGMPVGGDMHSWQQNIGYVPQSIFILNGTIRENIAFGEDLENVDDERIAHVLHQVGLDAFVKRQPEGDLVQVGENGILLSGGQRQRVGIARALYKQPEVLVLDEATASLDNETERRISDLIDSLKGECTIIVIAHRFAAIQHCDEVVVLSEGDIVERGGFEELLQTKGVMYQLYEAQKLRKVKL